jgi:subtilisin-like proprotein convertase family protein
MQYFNYKANYLLCYKYKIKILFYTAIVFFLPFQLSAQTYSGTGGAIPDTSSISFSLNVSGLSSSAIDTVSFGLEKVCIDIAHTWMGDLQISLIAPDGTRVMLAKNNGAAGSGYANTCFNSAGDSSVIAGTAPFNGTYKPIEQIGAVNNGQDGNGVWQLFCKDIGPSDTGRVLGWSITFGSNPEKKKFFRSSNLPVIVINTHGKDIVDTPKIIADMGIVNNGPTARNYVTDPFNNYNGKIGIELRGASSLFFPQNSYSVETRDTSLNSWNVSLLSLPAEHDWILYGPYQDKSLMRNVLTYKIARDMGHYASRTKFCELIVDDEYEGIYVMMEKIKRAKNRVNIANLQQADTIGDALTGGYIVKIDWVNGGGGDGWHSKYPSSNNTADTVFFQYDDPKADAIELKQKNYIHAYIDSFETVLAGPGYKDPLTGYIKYIDRTSFIDFFLVNELSRNVDAYRASTYLYKDKDSKGGKLFMGPVWDFNYAWYNANFCGADSSTGWQYLDLYCNPKPFWYKRFMQDPGFTDSLQCRWRQLRANVLDLTNINKAIDSIVILTSEARVRHFDKWPLFGIEMGNPVTANYQEEVDHLKTWISDRISWLDNNIPGNCTVAGISPKDPIDIQLNVYPNPFTSKVNFKYYLKQGREVNIKLFDLLGKEVKTLVNEYQSGNKEFEWDGTDLNGMQVPADLYICLIQLNGEVVKRTKLIKY